MGEEVVIRGQAVLWVFISLLAVNTMFLTLLAGGMALEARRVRNFEPPPRRRKRGYFLAAVFCAAGGALTVAMGYGAGLAAGVFSVRLDPDTVTFRHAWSTEVVPYDDVHFIWTRTYEVRRRRGGSRTYFEAVVVANGREHRMAQPLRGGAPGVKRVMNVLRERTGKEPIARREAD